MEGRYTLENRNIRVRIMKKGAEIVSLSNKMTETEFLWQQGEAWPKTSPILFPVVGGVINDKYTFKGVEYAMPKHGFARDMDFEVESMHSDSITFYLKNSEETAKFYPFEFKFSLTYSLTDTGVKMEYKVENRGIDTMYASFGAHPAFDCPISSDMKLTDYFLEFDQKETVDKFVLDGMYVSLNKAKDLANCDKIVLNDTIFNDDALIYEGLKSKSVTLKNSKNSKSVKIGIENFDYLAFWSKPAAGFVCVEPWCGIADFVNHNSKLEDKIGIKQIKPKESVSATMKIAVQG